VTLLELLVVLAVLGLVLGVSGLGLASLREPGESAALTEIRRARAEAIRSGVPVRSGSVLFLPDGRAIGPTVDPLTGESSAR
jgi:prepilin-type N-terminal cleavage/methylation domain-containing protein